MQVRIPSSINPLALTLLPLAAILAGRFATHSELAARYPAQAALLFLWLAADALALALIAKAPANRPGLRAVLGAIAAGCVVATLAAADPVRDALLEMRPVVFAMGVTVALYFAWSGWLALRTFRSSGSIEAALGEILPQPLVSFAAQETEMLRLALFRWGAEPHVPEGARGFAYHRVINPMIAVFLVLQVIEIVVVDLLVSHWSERAALVLLALGIWGALFLIALMKAFRLYPILLDDSGVHVRGGTLVDRRIPYHAIAAIEPSISAEEAKTPGVLNAAILSHPNVVLRLSTPIEHRGFLGRTRSIERVAFRLDEPAPFLKELAAKI
ncbi:hypothetical protein [Erythrobacter sp. HKB08]|uniref:hypothetical protein n=1 Tax=Erythrobacter sp. HKB08 TaxID=2502843 RepID=UPI001008C784|nr:hypothetical protein [Erythrobacter sp. HKB08]